ncbi:UNVERIFIED_CONTAM: hypothetical protein GTU68_012097 [Idotea baltica]|nr:hypothetical protein [Idotea baltica]
MKFTFFGHASFALEINGKNLVFDPFISANAATHSIIDLERIKADFVLLTHGHQDHILDALALAKQNDATIISTYEVGTWYQQNQNYEKVIPMNHGGQKRFDFGQVKLVNAVHSSCFPDGSYAGNPCGFVINSSEGDIYIAGDTALTMDMKLIPLWAKLKTAILPIGDHFTMGYEDALIASDFVACDKIIGVHFDTFPPINVDKERAKETFAAKGKELILLEIGESIDL